MSSEPYTPEETILRDICVTSMRMDGEKFDRFIAKVRADALREAAESARAVIEIGSSGDSAYHHGARYGQRKFADWLDVRAERIEGKRDKRVAGRWEPQA